MLKDMTTGKPLKGIVLFTIPLFVKYLLNHCFNMADTIIVGQLLGEDAFAAIGSTGSIIFMINGFVTGITHGIGIMISNAFGAKEMKRLKHYVAVAIMLSFFISVILMVIAVSWSQQLLVLMKTPENILSMANDYVSIIFAGLPISMFDCIGYSILYGIGNSKMPLFFSIISSVVNIILNLFFIVIIGMGSEGTAYATVIAQSVSATICFIYMFCKYDILRIAKDDFYLDFRTTRDLLFVGIPMSINNSVTAIGIMYVQSAVNSFGSSVVASYTAATKVDLLATLPMAALGAAMATYCGQNLGARKYSRIFDGIKKSLMLSILLIGFAALISAFFGEFIVCLFLSEATETVLTYAKQFLRTGACFYILIPLIYIYRNALIGLNHGLMPMLCGIFELICRFVIVTLMLEPFGYWTICLSGPFSWLVAAVPLTITYFLWQKKMKKIY